MIETMLSVSAIQKGTVIDHILVGMGLKIVRLLKLDAEGGQITMGLNLKSQSSGLKDLIKVEDLFLTKSQAAQIAIFSPQATVNVIENYRVCQKFSVHLPEKIYAVFSCPNPRCITLREPISTAFRVEERNSSVFLHCLYCEKTFSRDDVQEKVL